MRNPTFFERLQMDGQAPNPDIADGKLEWEKTYKVDRAIIARTSHLTKLAAAALNGDTRIPEHAVLREATTAERKLIATIRKALKEYDRTVKPDGRVGNGRTRVDPKAVRRGVVLVLSGVSIRAAARRVGVSFGTLWKATQTHDRYTRPTVSRKK